MEFLQKKKLLINFNFFLSIIDLFSFLEKFANNVTNFSSNLNIKIDVKQGEIKQWK